jgi:hypothetical protein
VNNIAALMPVAAKLLLHYLDADGETLPPKEQMQETGLGRTQYFAAKAQLREFGFIDARGNLTWTPGAFAKAQPTASTPEAVEVAGPLTVAQVTEGIRRLPELLPSLSSGSSDDMTVRQRAAEADRMEDSGEWNVASSPRNQRRRAQIAVLQEAWREVFGKDLTADNAKQFISKNGGYCEDLIDLFRDCKARMDEGRVKSPVGWLLAKLNNQQGEAQKQGVRQTAIGPASGPGAEDEGTMLADFTPAYKAKQAKIEAALARRGRKLEDDGWDE